jgi:hypothetical protein
MKYHHALMLSCTLFSLPGWAVTLINSDEAKAPPAAYVPATRGIFRGPGVKVSSPDTSMAVPRTFDLRVVFEPRGESRIDPAATRMVYLKATPVDLLPRVKASASGLTLEGAEVPPGEHFIQISVQDSEGRVTNSLLHLNVVK